MDLAIVGGGVAGAGVAFALRATDHRVEVFERAASLGGRTTARQRDGCTYDPGANYLKAVDPQVNRVVTQTLDTSGLVDVQSPVWTFDETGTIAPGDDRDDHKWTYETGLSTLVERLLASTSASVSSSTPVTHLDGVGDEWDLYQEAESLGRFDRVVLTPPAGQTASLLAASGWRSPLKHRLVTALEAVPYRPVVSAILHYPFRIDQPYYALVNTDGAHAISWLSREEEKDGHVPSGESLLIVQFAPAASARQLNSPAETVCAEAGRAVAALLDDERLATPDWTDCVRWHQALVDESVASEPISDAAEADLWFAGDWIPGEARVHAALQSGLDTGRTLG